MRRVARVVLLASPPAEALACDLSARRVKRAQWQEHTLDADSESVEDQTAKVIDITSRAGEISPELTAILTDELLSNNAAVKGLHAIAEKAGKMQADQLEHMSPSDFDSALASAGSLEEKLALAELQGTLAKFGLTPLNTVEGLIRLREALVQMYRDNTLVPAETRVQAAELRTALGVIEVKHDFVLATEKHRQDLANVTAELDLERARAEAQVERVEIAGRRQTAIIHSKLLERKKQTEYLAEWAELLRSRRHTIWRGLLRPAVRTFAAVSIPLVLVSNLVADDSQYRDTFVLGAVNDVWDTAWTPIQAGVIRIVRQFGD